MTIGIYFATLVALAVIDSIWLFSTAAFYKTKLAHLFASQISYAPAVVFYLLYVFGLMYFVIGPALQNHSSLGKVLLAGAIFGIVAYATYDLTNQATMKEWPMLITFLDIVWGAILTSAVSTLIVWIFSRS